MCILKDGNKFEGKYKNGNINGYGSFNSKNGFKIKGKMNKKKNY